MKSRTTFYGNLIFGIEDSLVSTVGLFSGVAIVGIQTKEIILTGVVLPPEPVDGVH